LIIESQNRDLISSGGFLQGSFGFVHGISPNPIAFHAGAGVHEEHDLRTAGVRGNRGRGLSGKGPIAEQALQLLLHFGPVKIAANRQNEIGGAKPLFVERFEVAAGNAFHGRRRGITIGPKLLTGREKSVLAPFDGATWRTIENTCCIGAQEPIRSTRTP